MSHGLDTQTRQSEHWMVNSSKTRIGSEAVVCFMGQRGTVIFNVSVAFWNINRVRIGGIIPVREYHIIYKSTNVNTNQ